MSDAPEALIRLPSYRALLLMPDGTVVDTQPLIAADDDEAISLAKSMMNGHAIELWDGLRFIEHFDLADRGF